jgi:hypothetical protein
MCQSSQLIPDAYLKHELVRQGEITMPDIQRVDFNQHRNCLLISNGTAEVIIATEIGPRIVGYRLVGKENVFAELGANSVEKTEFGEWHPWGGHRLWHSPEAMPRSYYPDDIPVQVETINDNSVKLTEAVEPPTGIQKEMKVILHPEGSRVTILHKLTNHGIWPVELAPWALTIVRGGGTVIIPNEPFVPHSDDLLPARTMILWKFTDLGDPRWTFGSKYIRLQSDGTRPMPQKIGVGNKQEWAAYLGEGSLFVKRFPYVEGEAYPDDGCNFETFTEGLFTELESLGPLCWLQPGESTVHVEDWFLFDGVKIDETDESIDKNFLPLIEE